MRAGNEAGNVHDFDRNEAPWSFEKAGARVANNAHLRAGVFDANKAESFVGVDGRERVVGDEDICQGECFEEG